MAENRKRKGKCKSKHEFHSSAIFFKGTVTRGKTFGFYFLGVESGKCINSLHRFVDEKEAINKYESTVVKL